MIVRTLKSPLGLIALGALSLSVHSVFAQTVGPVNNPLGQTVTLKPGEYNFKKYQQEEVFQKHIQQISANSKQAAELYQQTIKEYFDAFATFQSFVNETIIKRANESMYGKSGPIPIGDYMELIRQYNEKKNLIELKIEGIRTFPEGLKERVLTDAPTTGVNSTTTITAGLDFNALAKAFTAKLLSVDENLAKAKVLVKTKLGKNEPVQLMDASWVTLEYTQEEIDAIQTQISEKSLMTSAQRQTMNTYTNFLIQKILFFVKTYGTDEAWRPNMHDAEYYTRRDDEVKTIAQAFWQRSYIRTFYGVNTGAIAIKYNTKAFGIDRFFTNMNNIEFYPVINSENDLISAKKQLAELFKTAGSKGKAFSDIMAGKADAIDSVNSAVSFITGSHEVAKVWGKIAGIILNDMAEEKKMMEGDRDWVIKAYKGRYYGVKANPKNPDGLTDKQHFIMEEYKIDYNKTRMEKDVASGLIPRKVTQVANRDPKTLVGQALAAVQVGRSRAAAMKEVSALQSVVDSWIANDETGGDTRDELLDR